MYNCDSLHIKSLFMFEKNILCYYHLSYLTQHRSHLTILYLLIFVGLKNNQCYTFLIFDPLNQIFVGLKNIQRYILLIFDHFHDLDVIPSSLMLQLLSLL